MNIFTALIEHVPPAILYTVVLINFSKLKLSILNIVTIIIVLTLTGIVAFSFISINHIEFASLIANIVIIIALTIATQQSTRVASISIFYAVGSVLIILFSSSLSAQVMRIFGLFPMFHPRHYIGNNILLIILSLGVLFMLAYIISRYSGNIIYNKIEAFDISMKKRFANYMLGGATITLILFFIHTFLRFVIDDYSILNTIYILALMGYFAFLVKAIFTITDKFQKETELSHQKEMTDRLQAYTANIEEMVDGMKKFKHDHKNLLQGFSEHLKNNDIDNARKYFTDYMECFIESTADINASLNDLVRLNIPELKSLLMFKFLRAMQQGIHVHVDIRKPIENAISDNILDLCRISGILIDNAIEASLDANKPVLKFLAYMDGAMITFIFANTYAVDSVPQLDKLFDDGFTTKGEGRGHGLHTVLQIMNESEIFSIGASTNGEFFEQELNIIP